MLAPLRKSFPHICCVLLCLASFLADCVAEDYADWEKMLVGTLAEGRQSEAESMALRKLEEAAGQLQSLPEGSPEQVLLREELAKTFFWNAVLRRSRFAIEEATVLFCLAIDADPSSLNAKIAANTIGVDLAKNKETAFYFYNALLSLAEENPRSVPALWLTGILSRALTGQYYSYSLSQPELFHLRNCGVRHYEKLLREFLPGPGPVLVHQTLANLLSDLRCYDLALMHRETALKMERSSWVLHAMGCELLAMGSYKDAIVLFQEAISKIRGTPRHAYYFKDLGTAFRQVGRYTEALDAWDKAAEIDPGCSGFWQNYVRVCRQLGDYPRARKLLHKILESYPGYAEAKVLEASMAALCDAPDAIPRQKEAGKFTFDRRIQKDNSTETDPWEVAISYGDTKAFLSMVNQRDINAPMAGNYAQTPLMIAAQNGWMPILRELIRRGADLDAVDTNKDTALHYASQFNMPEAVVALVEAGANPNVQDKWAQTPLIMCLSNNNREGARTLLANGADPTLSTGHGGAALNYAAGYGEVEMLKSILAKGVSPGVATGNNEETAIMVGCGEYYHQTIVPPLIEAGADINAGDKNGNTALHRATNPLLNRPLIYFLLDNGADPNRPNAKGITPLCQARLLGYDDMAEQMEKAAGAETPFQFPEIEPAKTEDPISQAAAQIITPVLLAQGHPSGPAADRATQEKRTARKELARIFGISGKKQFEETLGALLDFRPEVDENSLAFPDTLNKDTALQIILDRAEKSYGDKIAPPRENAWVLAHVIYLADLGAAAEMIPPEDADALIREMVEATKNSFVSWREFYQSFLAGTKRYCGWEHERYANICRRLNRREMPWLR